MRLIKLAQDVPVQNIVLKIIKRNTTIELHVPVPAKRQPSRTVTSTVNDWISESRKNRLERETSTRKTIADWAAESI